jgi:hypothetical protein
MTTSGTRLEGITKELRARWFDTKEHWHDAKAREFESKYMQELFATVDKTVTIIEELDKLLEKVKKDCE